MTRAVDVIPHLAREGGAIQWDVAFTPCSACREYVGGTCRATSNGWAVYCSDIKVAAELPWATLANPRDIYTGTGLDGQIVGLKDALIGDVYSGISRSTYHEWKGNFLRANGPLSADIIKRALRDVYVASGMRPNLLLCHESAPRIKPTAGGVVAYDPDCPPNMAFLLNTTVTTSHYDGHKCAYTFIAEMGNRSQLVVERPNTCALILLEDA